jgi:hypothetical protein
MFAEVAGPVPFLSAKKAMKTKKPTKARNAMETLMNGAMLVEAALLSFLLALWITWLVMSGLFRLMPATTRQIAAQTLGNTEVATVRFVAPRQSENRQRRAA